MGSGKTVGVIKFRDNVAVGVCVAEITGVIGTKVGLGVPVRETGIVVEVVGVTCDVGVAVAIKIAVGSR